MKERWLHAAGLVALLASLALIAYATLTPDPAAGGTPDWLAHLLLFAALGGSATLAFASGTHPARSAALAMLVALAFATFTEVAQGPLDTRSPSLSDWAADALGAAVGVLVGVIVVRLLARRD